MPTPILTTVAAGLRSALVVDIGWAETTVTSVYEFREVQSNRSIRASKMLGETVFNRISNVLSDRTAEDTSDISNTHISFEECEEIVERMIWCKSMRDQENRQNTSKNTTIEGGEKLDTIIESSTSDEETETEVMISLPLNSIKPPKVIQVPFSEFSEPCEIAFFAKGVSDSELDDEELPLHLLVYKSLVKLPVDVRAICMSRIVFVGGASQIPGLKKRVMQELSSLREARGWSNITGRVINQTNQTSKLSRVQVKQGHSEESVAQNTTPSLQTKTASLIPQEHDPITEKVRHESRKSRIEVVSGKLRAINSLGAWSGASLMSLMKIQPNSVIEKEQWAQNSTNKFSRPGETSLSSQRQSMGSGAMRSGIEERSSWNLRIWSH